MPHADRSGSFRRHSPIVRGSSRSMRRSRQPPTRRGRGVERVPQPLLRASAACSPRPGAARGTRRRVRRGSASAGGGWRARRRGGAPRPRRPSRRRTLAAAVLVSKPPRNCRRRARRASAPPTCRLAASHAPVPLNPGILGLLWGDEFPPSRASLIQRDAVGLRARGRADAFDVIGAGSPSRTRMSYSFADDDGRTRRGVPAASCRSR